MLFLAIPSAAHASCPGATGEALERCNCYEIQSPVESTDMICTEDADCVSVPDNCGGLAAFNKKHLEKYQELYKSPRFSPMDASSMTLRCQNNSCVWIKNNQGNQK